jgi:16S rRNA (cytidine1402-2'-O)-methyltransferase
MNKNKGDKSSGVLYVVSTPIGNLEDITLRALRVLKEADLVAAEDTRRTRQLLTHYGIHKPLISYHEFNRRLREETLIEELRGGRSVALVTDAGTPGISDPGEELVRRAIQESIPLIPIPGPSALVVALSVSGLPTESFLFHGFLPSKASARRKWIQSAKERTETLLFYESPRRLRSFLEDALQILGDRRVVVAREMTKVYEEVLRGRITEVLKQLTAEVKGEVTVILEGGTHQEKPDFPTVAEALKHYSRSLGLSMKESVSRVSEDMGVSRREVYQESLKIKEREEQKDPAPREE